MQSAQYADQVCKKNFYVEKVNCSITEVQKHPQKDMVLSPLLFLRTKIRCSNSIPDIIRIHASASTNM